jgi:hypothetical protein
MKKVLSILLLVFLIGCNKVNTTDPDQTDNNDAEYAVVKLQYVYWASASKSHNYSNMKSLVVPGSNFDGMTEDCKDSWDGGYETYYTFSNLKVVEFNETSAAVDGQIQLIQGDNPDYNYSGSFQSYAVKREGRWLLHGMNVSWD